MILPPFLFGWGTLLNAAISFCEGLRDGACAELARWRAGRRGT